MGRCKEIELKVIPASVANPFVKKHHYSGKVVNNSQLHFGAFLDGRLHGVMSFGPSMDKKKIQPLVAGTGWNEFIELNRMAFDDYLPRNSESYCIGHALRMIKKQAPQIKWVVSFADGTQCGDGTIYRASNFVLTGITENKSMLRLPDGKVICALSLTAGLNIPRPELDGKSVAEISNGRASIKDYIKHTNAEYINGFMLRYIYFIDKSCRQRLTVPELPFLMIDEMKAGMYKGEKVSQAERHAIKTEHTEQ